MNKPAEQLSFEDSRELIVLESTLPAINFNYEQLKDRLEEELVKYEIAVTTDTVAEAKKSATELNKLKTQLDEKRKEEIARVSAPIKEADEKLRELVGLCKDSRQKILDQVEKFENETRRLAQKLLDEYREQLYSKHDINPEFRMTEINDLIKLTAVTAKGNLSKSVKDELEKRVWGDKAVQDKVERRLVQLENASYKAGLSVPLARDHVAHFLKAEDEVYEEELSRIIDAEIVRQEQAEIAMRKKLEREAEQKAEQERREKEQQDRIARVTPESVVTRIPESVPEPVAQEVRSEEPASYEPATPAPAGKTLFVISATFEVLAPSTVTEDRVKAKLRSTLEAAGITSLTNIQAARI